jgi:hypothetical protein
MVLEHEDGRQSALLEGLAHGLAGMQELDGEPRPDQQLADHEGGDEGQAEATRIEVEARACRHRSAPDRPAAHGKAADEPSRLRRAMPWSGMRGDGSAQHDPVSDGARRIAGDWLRS